MPVEGNGDEVETNGDPVGSTTGEREPEPVWTGVSRGGYLVVRFGRFFFRPRVRLFPRIGTS